MSNTALITYLKMRVNLNVGISILGFFIVLLNLNFAFKYLE